MFSNFFKFINLVDSNNIQSVDEFLKVYGGKSFLNGMYRIFKRCDVAKWDEIIRKSYPRYNGKLDIFGFDWLGRIFAVDIERDAVLLFEPGTGEVLDIQVSFIDFHNAEIPKSHNACLASSYFNEWYEANNRYTLDYNQCVGYKVPLFLGGVDEIGNLEISDMEVYWEIMMPLMNL